MKRLFKLLSFMLIALIAILAVACSGNTNNNTSGNTSTTGNTGSTKIEYTADEQAIIDAVSYDFTALKDDTAIPEDAAYVEASSSKVSLTGGNYVFSGEYTKGITITAEKDVHIYLNGATITNSGKKALTIEKGDTENDVSIIITIVDGTVNDISNTESKNAFDSGIPVYINGSGTLNVSSTGNNVIKVDGSLVIVDATINVENSAKNAISAYSAMAKDCTITVLAAAKDGIHAEMDDDITAWTENSGYVVLYNVNYTANVLGDGVQADTFVYIDGGTYDITTTASFVSYSEWQGSVDEYDLETDDFKYAKSGNTFNKKSSKTINSITGLYAMEQSAKGIKVGEIDYEVDGTEYTVSDGNYYIIIQSGTFNINSDDDAIHANGGNIAITGGTFTIETLDDGITADLLVKIEGGNITVNKCFEGIEGGYVEITGGAISLTCTDDGINAASDDFNNEYIKISGGTITVNAEGDGIDSNGTATISGGTVYVFGPTAGDNSALDSESTVNITGGTVIAISREAMDRITCNNPYITTSITISKDVAISVGGVVSGINVPKAYSGATVIVCSENMTANTAYTLTCGTKSVNLTAKTGSIGGMGGGGQGGFGGGPRFR